MDNLRVASRLGEHYMQTIGRQGTRWGRMVTGMAAAGQHEIAVKYANALVEEVKGYLLPRLDKIAAAR